MAQTLHLMDIDDRLFGDGATVYYTGLYLEETPSRVNNNPDDSFRYFGIIINAASPYAYPPVGTIIVAAFNRDRFRVWELLKENPFNDIIGQTVSIIPAPLIPVEGAIPPLDLGSVPGHWYTLRADGSLSESSVMPNNFPQPDMELAYDFPETTEGLKKIERIKIPNDANWDYLRLYWADRRI